MQVEDIDPIEAESRQTAFERLRHGLGNAAEVAARQPDLGADGHVGRVEPLQMRPRFFSDSPLPYCTAVSK